MTGLVDHEEGCARVASRLATLRLWLLLWVLRTQEGTFRPLLQQRGAGAEASRGGVVNMAVNSSAVRDGSHSGSAQA